MNEKCKECKYFKFYWMVDEIKMQLNALTEEEFHKLLMDEGDCE